MTLTGSAAVDVTPTIQEVLGALSQMTMASWPVETLVHATKAFESLGILPGGLPFVTASILVPYGEVPGGSLVSNVVETNAKDRSAKSQWLYSLSFNYHYYMVHHCNL